MILFFATIFIAELIIAGTLLSFIIKADRKVCAANEAVIAFKPMFETGLREAYNIVRNLKQTLHYIICLIERKKKEYILNIVSFICLETILFFWRGKYKKVASFLQLVILFDKLAGKIAACKKT